MRLACKPHTRTPAHTVLTVSVWACVHTFTTGMCCGFAALRGTSSAPFSPSVMMVRSHAPATASSCCCDHVSVSTSDRNSDTRGPRPSCKEQQFTKVLVDVAVVAAVAGNCRTCSTNRNMAS